MFEPEHQFFPTPLPVVIRIWEKVRELKRGLSTVLDPSAGKGDLLNYGCDNRRLGTQGYAIEIDANLRAILREQRHEVIGGDFMEWHEPIVFDAVVANPPFNRGVDHVLRAWEFVADGGCLVAIVNSETIANPFSSERKRLLSLIDIFGGSQDLGQVFKKAERPCDVEVSMVWLQKPKKEVNPDQFQFTGNFQKASDEVFEAFAANPLAAPDAIDNLVAQYKVCLNILKARHQAQTELQYHLSSLDLSSYHRSEDKEALLAVGDFSQGVRTIKKMFWATLFQRSKMKSITTSDFIKKFEEFVDLQISMSFDRNNILEALHIFSQNKEKIMLDSVCSVFDRALKFSKDNVTHSEGWVTNSGSKMNRKIILPFGAYWRDLFSNWIIDDKNKAFLNDLDETLCWVAGVPFDHKGAGQLINWSEYPPNKWQESRFYRFKLFRKGTIHLEFNDQYLLDDFNAMAARGRQWVGGDGF
jgi:16S rRNA A1518/A1519 N6-dimethyltransferase RsmA/KsgA/DIM1 with predicted DNA glycosylase/AP lyase activity